MTRLNIQSSDLTGKLLIAMPSMGDPRFAASVIYILAHNEDGTMGLVVNKPLSEVSFSDILGQLNISCANPVDDMGIFYGGPVEPGRGFVLHSGEYRRLQGAADRDKGGGSIEVNEQFSMTSTVDVLEDIALGTGPKQALVMLGYSGWGAGQLEAELAQNAWLTCDATPELVFGTAQEVKWQAAVESFGIDPRMLSATGGRA
ncbi:YqgE/AlgH family protein [Rhodophyticola sp. SM2404]